MKIKKGKLTSAIEAALFTAIICIVSQIAIPTPLNVPITLQTFAIALCGYWLGLKWGLAATAVYIILGAVGLPVFSFFRGGTQVLTSATGGFIIGFLILSASCGIASRFKKTSLKLLLGIVGLLICHMIGILQFSFVSNTTLFEAAAVSSLPFLIKDIILVIASYPIAKKYKKQRQ